MATRSCSFLSRAAICTPFPRSTESKGEVSFIVFDAGYAITTTKTNSFVHGPVLVHLANFVFEQDGVRLPTDVEDSLAVVPPHVNVELARNEHSGDQTEPIRRCQL